jgi:hypothetical protein
MRANPPSGSCGGPAPKIDFNILPGGELSTMYSAWCAPDCQEKRLLTWRFAGAESNLSVKKISYCLFGLRKKLLLIAGTPGKVQNMSHFQPKKLLKFFPKWQIAAGNPRAFRLGFKCFRFDAPRQICAKWGGFPQNVFRKTGP